MGESSLFTRKRLAVLAVVVLVAFAGCAGGTSDDNDDDSGVNKSEALAEFGSDLEDDVTPASELSVDKETVTSNALAAMESVETYEISTELTVNTTQNNVDRSRTLDSEVAVDRGQQEFAVEQVVTVGTREVTTDVYFVDGTLYQRSAALASQVGSEWIKIDVGDNQSQQFRAQDEVGLHERLLENGSVTFVGKQAVDGEDAYRLRIESDASSLAEYLDMTQEPTADVNYTAAIWVSADSGDLLRSEGFIETTVDSEATTAESTIQYTETFTYTDVSVTLPDAASTAVEIDDAGQLQG